MEIDEATSVPPSLPNSTTNIIVSTFDHVQTNETDEIMNSFYCSKCYDMVNYFISECQTLSSQLNSVKRIYTLKKKDYKTYRGLYDTLEFNFEEMKAQKEDFEERYNILIRSLTKQQMFKQDPIVNSTASPALPIPHVEETNHLALTTVKQVKQSNVVYINDMDSELGNMNMALDAANQPTLVLDLDVLTNEFSAQANINYQLIFKYFSTKINELNKLNSNKLKAYKDKLKNKLAIENKISSVESASLSIKIDSNSSLNKETEEKLAWQEEELNKLRNDLSDYEKLKVTYEKLNDFVEGAKLENELLQNNLIKTNSQISQLSNRNDQLVDQLTQLEIKNQSLNQEIEMIKQKTTSDLNVDKIIQDDYEKLIKELNEKMSAMENETKNLKELNKMLLTKKQEDTERFKVELESTKTSASSQMEELNEKLRKVEEYASSLELELNTLKETSSRQEIDANRDLDEMKQHENRLNDEFNALRMSYDQLNNEMNQTISKSNEKANGLMSDLENCNQIINGLNEEIARVRLELDESNKEINNLRSKVEDLGQVNNGLNEEINRLRSEFNDSSVLRDTLSEKEAENQNLKAEYERVNNNLVHVNQAYDSLIQNHQEMVQQAEKSFWVFNAELDILKNKNEELNAQINQVKETESQFVQTNTPEIFDQEAQTDFMNGLLNVKELVESENKQDEVEDMVYSTQHLDDVKQRYVVLKAELDERVRLFEDRAQEINELIKQNNQLRSNELAHIENLTQMTQKLTWNENEVNSLRSQLAEFELNFKSQFDLSESLKQSVYLKEQEFIAQANELNNTKRQLIELELSYNNQLEMTESLKQIHQDKEAQFDVELNEVRNELNNLNHSAAVKEGRINELDKEMSKMRDDLNRSDELVKEYQSKLNEQICKYNELEANTNSLAQELDKLREHNDTVLNEKVNMEKWTEEITAKLENMTREKEEAIEKYERELVDAINSSSSKQNEFTQIEMSLRNENQTLNFKLDECLKQIEQLNQLEIKLCEYNQVEMSLRQENEQLIHKLNESLAQIEQLRQLESKLCEFSQAEMGLKHENEQLTNKLNGTLNQIEILKQIESKLNDEVSKQNEELTNLNNALETISSQREEFKNNLEAQIQTNKQLEIEINNQRLASDHLRDELEFLKATSSQVNETNNDLNCKLNQYQIQIKESQSELHKLTETNAKLIGENKCFISSIEQSKLELKETHHKLEELNKSYANLKQNYAEKDHALKKMQFDYENISVKLKDFDSLKQLELAELKKNYDNNEYLLNKQLKELSDKLQTNETQVEKLKANTTGLISEISELRTQLIETQNEAEQIKYDYEKKLESDIYDKGQRAIEFELKYKEEVNQNEELRADYERRIQTLIDNEIKLTDAITNLNKSLNDQYANVATLNKYIGELKLEMNAFETQMGAKSDQINEWMDKYNKQHNRLSEMESYTKGLIDNINCLNDTISNLNSEKQELAKSVDEYKLKWDQMNAERAKLNAELETSNKEKFELQRKLCDSFKELVEKSNKYDMERQQLEDIHVKLQNKLDHLEAVLKQQNNETKALPSGVLPKSSNMNESFMSKLDNRIDQNIQHKLDALYEEKHKSLIEIEHLNAEIKNLKLQLETQKEKITKENKKAYKEQIQNYEKTIAKQTNEIKRLKEVNDDMQETNNFLNNQINNLNQQIFELNNKENDYEVIDKQGTPNSASSSSSFSKPKLGNQNNYINKKLLDSSLSTEYIGTANNKQHLQEIDMNSSKPTNNFDENFLGTPMNSNKNKSNIPATPSSSVRKQNQCAQQ